MDQSEYQNHVSTTVNHFYEKLFYLKNLMNTVTAKQLAEKKDAYMKAFIHAEGLIPRRSLCVVTKGIKADCNHLMRTTTPMLCVGVVDCGIFT
ncbi:MAG: hypothetical protein P1P65_06065 [Treponema sp.]